MWQVSDLPVHGVSDSVQGQSKGKSKSKGQSKGKSKSKGQSKSKSKSKSKGQSKGKSQSGIGQEYPRSRKICAHLHSAHLRFFQNHHHG